MNVWSCGPGCLATFPDFVILQTLTSINSKTTQDNPSYWVCFGSLSSWEVRKWGWSLSPPTKKLIAFKRNSFAKSGNTVGGWFGRKIVSQRKGERMRRKVLFNGENNSFSIIVGGVDEGSLSRTLSSTLCLVFFHLSTKTLQPLRPDRVTPLNRDLAPCNKNDLFSFAHPFTLHLR